MAAYQMPYQNGIAGYQSGMTQGPLWSPQQTGDALNAIRSFAPATGNAFGGNTGLQDQSNDWQMAHRNKAATDMARMLNPINTTMQFGRQVADAGAGQQMQGWLGSQANWQAQNNPYMRMILSLLG